MKGKDKSRKRRPVGSAPISRAQEPLFEKTADGSIRVSQSMRLPILVWGLVLIGGIIVFPHLPAAAALTTLIRKLTAKATGAPRNSGEQSVTKKKEGDASAAPSF